MNTLTAVVPFYNEENYLGESIERLLKIKQISEILLIDDCSTDNSSFIANKIVQKNKNVKLLTKTNNGGKGSCLKDMSNIIKTTHVIVHDADLEYDPIDIIEMFKKTVIFDNSLIIGSRFLGSIKRSNVYKRTYYANKLMSLFFSIINLYKVTDVATCYKLMPANFLKEITLKEDGFSIEIEILSKFLKYNRSIIEVPIKYEGRSYSQGKKIKTYDGFKYLFNTLKYRFLN